MMTYRKTTSKKVRIIFDRINDRVAAHEPRSDDDFFQDGEDLIIVRDLVSEREFQALCETELPYDYIDARSYVRGALLVRSYAENISLTIPPRPDFKLIHKLVKEILSAEIIDEYLPRIMNGEAEIDVALDKALRAYVDFKSTPISSIKAIHPRHAAIKGWVEAKALGLIVQHMGSALPELLALAKARPNAVFSTEFLDQLSRHVNDNPPDA